MQKKSRRPHLKLVAPTGELIDVSSVRPRRLSLAAVHRKQVIGRNALTFPLGGLNDRGPGGIGNAAPLVPFADRPMTDADIDSHFGGGLPEIKNIVKGLGHDRYITRDYLSRNCGTTARVTKPERTRTMRPMGRGSTPTVFRKEFCQRLKAARVMAGLSQPEAAQALGILQNTYNKYETRNLPPHHLIADICELFSITPEFLYSKTPTARRKAAER